MKKGGILNKNLNEAINCMGHGDIMIIADAGLPVPKGIYKEVDLAIMRDYPDIVTILELILGEFIYEKCIVAEEQKLFNPVMFNKVSSLIDRCPVDTVPHIEIMEDLRNKAKVFVRTGAFMPWGNVILYSGIDAPTWFQKEGVITPDYYQKRASYEK
jgi:D-ribose pyranase